MYKHQKITDKKIRIKGICIILHGKYVKISKFQSSTTNQDERYPVAAIWKIISSQLNEPV